MDGASTVLVARGKKLLRFEMKDADTEELAKVILGRSGTLRAPAIRVGDTFVVGFHAEGYEALFG
jgi:arsenate reductase-like glutaredoxin family protein